MRFRSFAPSLVGATALALCMSIPAAETPSADFDLDEFRVPASPAFTILGVSPTEIERPSSARAFAFTALSAAERSGGDIPSNLAMEFTPYWWTDHPELKFEDVYEADIGERLAQTFAVSIATSELATYKRDDDAKGTALAFGVRANLLGGKPAPELSTEVTKLRQLQLTVADCFSDLDEDSESGTSEIAVPAECAEAATAIAAQAKRISALDKERVGLMLDAAVATVSEFPDSTTDEDRTSKLGAWLTWSYRSAAAARNNPNAQTHVVFVAIQRWIRDDILNEDAIDVGARLLYKAKDDSWSVSAEYLKRFGDDTLDSSASRVEFEYTISERYTLVAALGRDFATTDDRSPLIAIAGINVSLGRGASERSRP